MKKTFALPILFVFLYFCSCHTTTHKNLSGKDSLPAGAMLVDPDSPRLFSFKRNPEFRTQVKKEPVGEYSEKIDNGNDQYFRVRLYETPRTMYYLTKIDFGYLSGEDTIKLPDLGTDPHPVLQKGKDKCSCVIGLLDNDHRFREMKLVYIKNHLKDLSMKITTLKHYVVMDHYRLVSR